ncbi:MAG: DUF2937 family protein [Neomegalonema sp.]|nr:DUF2937 family protein [Neomegalonema sp.]
MIRRLFLMTGALAGGALLSQAPEFTQQYRQNLNGQVAELSRSVEGFRSDASRSGLSVNEALEDLRRSPKLGKRTAERTQANFVRLERLQAHEDRLATSVPGMRTVELIGNLDAEVAERAAEKFEPALPLTIEGALHAAVGGVIGYVLFSFILGGLGLFGVGRGRERRA